ncbi:MAG TPA: hypothetical protein VG798_01010 [Rhizomicrobium sp.]|nr:hypothetical protein [Rhizomicrobium sp.]
MTGFLLFLHIVLFVFSFAFTAGFGILGDRIAATGDAKTIHAYFRMARPMAIAGGIGWILTALAGGVLAGAFAFDMTAPWLLASYGAFAVLILVGFLIHLPWQAKVIAASAGQGPDLNAVLHAPSHRIATIVSALSILTIIFLMTVRPG